MKRIKRAFKYAGIALLGNIIVLSLLPMVYGSIHVGLGYSVMSDWNQAPLLGFLTAPFMALAGFIIGLVKNHD
jgi:hypothetical protein